MNQADSEQHKRTEPLLGIALCWLCLIIGCVMDWAEWLWQDLKNWRGR